MHRYCTRIELGCQEAGQADGKDLRVLGVPKGFGLPVLGPQAPGGERLGRKAMGPRFRGGDERGGGHAFRGLRLGIG